MLRDDAPSPPSHQRADGRADLVLAPAPGGSAWLRHLYQAAPLRWLFPDADPGEPKAGALVNVAGGLAGGDRVATTLGLEAGARFVATTPAAEKVYRSLGAGTEIACGLRVEDDACCEWLPQETILFDGARLRRRFDIALAPGARLLAAEMLVLGRAAHGEAFARGVLMDRWRVARGGRLAWADALRLDDPAAARDARFVLSGAGAVATLLLAAPDAAAHRDRARELAAGAASLVAPGLLVARWAGEAGAVRAAIGGAVTVLRADALGHPARLPRLWRT
ncbi:urease accessory protein UreD [Falsiroseomonas sp. CW058]|uniref:urease accessory protein UreD n=1 Tax=Falsiroseomonas sp. CW058 TaxID=3388664 RepID=UPI003D30EFFE